MYQKSESHLSNMEAARQKSLTIKTQCPYCEKLFGPSGISRHMKACKLNPATFRTCPVCKKDSNFSGTTCSHACANTYFRSGVNHPNSVPHAYRTVCFSYHKKECIICGEKNIVAVHHLDEDHSNNDPKNLIPLCPTHHQYLHSNFKHLIEDKVNAYVLSLDSRI